MSIFPTNAQRLTLLLCLFLTILSCSKDSDLIADYETPGSNGSLVRLVVDDSFYVGLNSTVVLDVLENDNFVSSQSVTIIETSTPSNGNVEINEDNTISYTSNSEGELTDSFTYTTEVVNEDESVSTELGTVTVKLTGDNVYYVTVNGNASNNGKSEASAWSIQHAMTQAKAGDWVYIKTGNYGNLQLKVANSGTTGNPIVFMGYRETPGDIVVSNESSFVYGEDSFNTNDYPSLVGNRSNGNVSGNALTINSSFVEIHNIQIKDYEKGIISYGNNTKLNNVIIHDLGNYSGYSGAGVILNGDNSEMTNSFIINVNAQAFTSTNGKNQIVENNWVGFDAISKPDDYSTDYYLLFSYSDNNTIRNNTIYRRPGTYHQGHGIIVKGGGKYNNFINNHVQNTTLEFSFSAVTLNTVTGGSITGTGTEGGNRKYAFILIANGAHHNTFSDIKISGDSGVRFADWDDGYTPSPDTDAESAGHDNVFRNIEFVNLLSAIEFGWQWYGKGKAENNIFENCTFENIKEEIFRTERGNNGTVLRNCTFKNNNAQLNLNTENINLVPNGGNPWALDVTFENCEGLNNAFTLP